MTERDVVPVLETVRSSLLELKHRQVASTLQPREMRDCVSRIIQATHALTRLCSVREPQQSDVVVRFVRHEILDSLFEWSRDERLFPRPVAASSATVRSQPRRRRRGKAEASESDSESSDTDMTAPPNPGLRGYAASLQEDQDPLGAIDLMYSRMLLHVVRWAVELLDKLAEPLEAHAPHVFCFAVLRCTHDPAFVQPWLCPAVRSPFATVLYSPAYSVLATLHRALPRSASYWRQWASIFSHLLTFSGGNAVPDMHQANWFGATLRAVHEHVFPPSSQAATQPHHRVALLCWHMLIAVALPASRMALATPDGTAIWSPSPAAVTDTASVWQAATPLVGVMPAPPHVLELTAQRLLFLAHTAPAMHVKYACGLLMSYWDRVLDCGVLGDKSLAQIVTESAHAADPIQALLELDYASPLPPPVALQAALQVALHRYCAEEQKDDTRERMVRTVVRTILRKVNRTPQSSSPEHVSTVLDLFSLAVHHMKREEVVKSLGSHLENVLEKHCPPSPLSEQGARPADYFSFQLAWLRSLAQLYFVLRARCLSDALEIVDARVSDAVTQIVVTAHGLQVQHDRLGRASRMRDDNPGWRCVKRALDTLEQIYRRSESASSADTSLPEKSRVLSARWFHKAIRVLSACPHHVQQRCFGAFRAYLLVVMKSTEVGPRILRDRELSALSDDAAPAAMDDDAALAHITALEHAALCSRTSTALALALACRPSAARPHGPPAELSPAEMVAMLQQCALPSSELVVAVGATELLATIALANLAAFRLAPPGRGRDEFRRVFGTVVQSFVDVSVGERRRGLAVVFFTSLLSSPLSFTVLELDQSAVCAAERLAGAVTVTASGAMTLRDVPVPGLGVDAVGRSALVVWVRAMLDSKPAWERIQRLSCTLSLVPALSSIGLFASADGTFNWHSAVTSGPDALSRDRVAAFADVHRALARFLDKETRRLAGLLEAQLEQCQRRLVPPIARDDPRAVQHRFVIREQVLVVLKRTVSLPLVERAPLHLCRCVAELRGGSAQNEYVQRVFELYAAMVEEAAPWLHTPSSDAVPFSSLAPQRPAGLLELVALLYGLRRTRGVATALLHAQPVPIEVLTGQPRQPPVVCGVETGAFGAATRVAERCRSDKLVHFLRALDAAARHLLPVEVWPGPLHLDRTVVETAAWMILVVLSAEADTFQRDAAMRVPELSESLAERGGRLSVFSQLRAGAMCNLLRAAACSGQHAVLLRLAEVAVRVLHDATVQLAADAPEEASGWAAHAEDALLAGLLVPVPVQPGLQRQVFQLRILSTRLLLRLLNESIHWRRLELDAQGEACFLGPSLPTDKSRAGGGWVPTTGFVGVLAAAVVANIAGCVRALTLVQRGRDSSAFDLAVLERLDDVASVGSLPGYAAQLLRAAIDFARSASGEHAGLFHELPSLLLHYVRLQFRLLAVLFHWPGDSSARLRVLVALPALRAVVRQIGAAPAHLVEETVCSAPAQRGQCESLLPGEDVLPVLLSGASYKKHFSSVLSRLNVAVGQPGTISVCVLAAFTAFVRGLGDGALEATYGL